MKINESWDPDYDDQPCNQFGEKWQIVKDTYLDQVIKDIMEDIQIDPYHDGPKMERLALGNLHLCEDGHLIATIYGGANGGGFRGIESNWPFYMSLVRKFLGKLLDYDNRQFFKDVWMIDWSNDCCDDCWTLVLGLELTDKEKLQMIECDFPVLNPEKLHISLDAAADLFTPMPVAQNVQASIPQANEPCNEAS